MKKLLVSTFGFLALPVLTLAHTGDVSDDSGYFHMMDWHTGNGGGMMGAGGGFFSFLIILTWIVWLVVGILAIVWLLQKISRK